VIYIGVLVADAFKTVIGKLEEDMPMEAKEVDARPCARAHTCAHTIAHTKTHIHTNTHTCARAHTHTQHTY